MRMWTSLFTATILASAASLAIAQAPAPPASTPAARGGFGGGGGGRGGFGGLGGIAPGFYVNQFDTMATQLNLSDEQRPKVKDKVDAMVKEIQEYQQKMQESLTAARGGGAGAGAGRGQMQAEMAKWQNDYQALINQHQLKINADLTQDQRVQWEKYKLNLFLNPRLNLMQLTDDQRQKVQELTDSTANTLASATDAAQIPAIQGKMIKQLVADVLTDDQASRLLQVGGAMFGGGRGGRGGGGAGGGGGGGGRGRGGNTP